MIVLEFILLLCIASAKSTIILQCCPKGQGLNDKQTCENVTQEWSPLVFSPARKSFLPPGTVPENFTFLEKFPVCDERTYFADTSNAVLTQNNGSLFLNDGVLQPETFCISPTGLLLCLANDHPLKKKKMEKWVKKCCVMDAVYSEVEQTCIPLNNTSNVNFLSEDTMIHSGFPYCESKDYIVAGKLDDEYSLNVDGTLRTKNRTPVANFCVEYILELPNDKASIFTCANSFPTFKQEDDIRFTIYPLGLFLSIFFLTITLISSCMLPSSYHALHWKCQTHYVACLLIGDFLLAITQLASDSLKTVSRVLESVRSFP